MKKFFRFIFAFIAAMLITNITDRDYKEEGSDEYINNKAQ